jgi:DNA-binding transcriptional MocR family regulator
VDIAGASAAEIAGSVRDLVGSGQLRAGASLPPIRELAHELGVNRNTVASAYRQLVAAGVAETRGRGGTVITSVPELDRDGSVDGRSAIDLASGNPDPRLLPDAVEAVGRGGYQLSLYGAPALDPRLAQRVNGHFLVDVERPFQLVVTYGSVDAVERLLTAHLTRGDAVAVEDPCFLASINTLRLNGFRSAPVPVDTEGMTPDGLAAALEAGARAVVCTPRAHNPTGASVTAARADELRTVLTRFPYVLVIEDDHFSRVSAVPYRRITPMACTRWALVRSVSKFLGPDLRVALVATDDDTASRLETRLSAGTTWVSHLLQHAVAELLADETTQKLLTIARATYAERSALLVDSLRAHGVSVPGSPDGLNIWIELDVDVRSAADALAQQNWLVRPGNLFATDPTRRINALRVTTSTITSHQASAFAADLAATLEQLHHQI